MTYRGRVANGKIVLPADVTLPDGAEVDISVCTPGSHPAASGNLCEPTSIEHEIAAIWADIPLAELNRLPADLGDNLDHYIYGTPRR